MKKLTILTMALMIMGYFSPAQAGSARRHTMEGIVLGTGITLVGAAIVNSMNREKQPACEKEYPRHREPGYGRSHGPYANHGPRGHWEFQKIWIQPEYEKRWNPGHYSRRGHWKEGRYEKVLVTPGHWQTERVWVSRRFNH